MIWVSLSENIDAQAEIERVKNGEAGAVVAFLGTARSDGGRVKALLYEHYDIMAEKTLREIAEEACKRFGLYNVSIAHRTGKVAAGDEAVVIALSSKHRKEGFDACSWIMDRIKERAPIWKEVINE